MDEIAILGGDGQKDKQTVLITQLFKAFGGCSGRDQPLAPGLRTFHFWGEDRLNLGILKETKLVPVSVK